MKVSEKRSRLLTCTVPQSRRQSFTAAALSPALAAGAAAANAVDRVAANRAAKAIGFIFSSQGVKVRDPAGTVREAGAGKAQSCARNAHFALDARPGAV